MTAAMALFAERGFDGTSVGEIERAAGLAARSGALYQYFKGGKEELLRSAIERELEAIDELGSVLDMLRQRLPDDGPAPDLSPLALILVEPMASYRSIRHTFGRVPDDIDDERFVAAWVDTALAV